MARALGEHAKQTSGQSLKEANCMKQLQTIIRTNERVAVALGNPYTVQLQHIYMELLSVYKEYSNLINQAIAQNGATNVHLMHTSGVRAMRAVKKETLRLLDTFIEKSEDNELVLCDGVGCSRAYHQSCLSPPLHRAIARRRRECCAAAPTRRRSSASRECREGAA